MHWVPRGEMFFVLVLLISANIPTSGTACRSASPSARRRRALSVLLAWLMGAANDPATNRNPADGVAGSPQATPLSIAGSIWS